MQLRRTLTLTLTLSERERGIFGGHRVRVTEWEAPEIPEAVLDSIEREAMDA